MDRIKRGSAISQIKESPDETDPAQDCFMCCSQVLYLRGSTCWRPALGWFRMQCIGELLIQCDESESKRQKSTINSSPQEENSMNGLPSSVCERKVVSFPRRSGRLNQRARLVDEMSKSRNREFTYRDSDRQGSTSRATRHFEEAMTHRGNTLVYSELSQSHGRVLRQLSLPFGSCSCLLSHSPLRCRCPLLSLYYSIGVLGSLRLLL